MRVACRLSRAKRKSCTRHETLSGRAWWLSRDERASIGTADSRRSIWQVTAARDADPAVEMQAKRLSFDHYVLDLDRGCLLLEGSEVALRPKTFAVLKCLVENSGRLISKDELFAAVWPNLAVTDDTLVQSIGELRRELGDDGPRLIKTIPRRGYRFDAAVTAASDAEPFVTDRPSHPKAFLGGAQSSKAVIGTRAWTSDRSLAVVAGGRSPLWSFSFCLQSVGC
jgi:DNA-binding winged helix-turn-helix (wHTH) protein